MAFASVRSNSTSTETSATVTHTVNVPTTVDTGDLLLLFLMNHGNLFSYDGDVSSGPSGFTELAADSGAGRAMSYIYVKVADGSEEGGTVTYNTSSACRSAHFMFSIRDWYGEISGGVEASAMYELNGTTSPDPPSLSPSWGSADTLWFALAGWVDDAATLTSFPNNYNDDQIESRATGTSNKQVCIAGASRSLAATTEDPGQFTLSETEFAQAWTVGVGPLQGVSDMKVNIGDALKDISDMKVNIGDALKQVTVMKINVGDALKEVFPG